MVSGQTHSMDHGLKTATKPANTLTMINKYLRWQPFGPVYTVKMKGFGRMNGQNTEPAGLLITPVKSVRIHWLETYQPKDSSNIFKML